MLTYDDIEYIKAQVEVAAWFNLGIFARSVVPSLLVDREELLELVKELAEALTQECAGDVGANFRNHTVLAKAHERLESLKRMARIAKEAGDYESSPKRLTAERLEYARTSLHLAANPLMQEIADHIDAQQAEIDRLTERVLLIMRTVMAEQFKKIRIDESRLKVFKDC